MVLIAAEKEENTLGRIRQACVGDASDKTLEATIATMASPGSTLITDGWTGYLRLKKAVYNHETVRSYGNVGEDLLPKCHMVASLMKQWIMGTLQGSISEKHLPDYLNEFTFRFNRRKSASRWKLFYRLAQMSVQAEACTYGKIVGTPPVGGSQVNTQDHKKVRI